MKVDQNQPPSRGPSDKPADPAPVQGRVVQDTAAPGAPAKETPLRSPFFNLLVKGRRGEEDSLPGTGTKENVEPEGELIFQAEHPLPHDENQKGGAGVFTAPPNQKTQRPSVEPKVVRQEVPESKTELPQNTKIAAQLPVSQPPVTAGKKPDVLPEASPKTVNLPVRRNILKADPKRRDTPGEEKTGNTASIATAPMPALRSESVRPVVSQVSAGSTAAVERIKALAGEIVDKMETTRGPKGDAKVDIQFNSRTLQGLQVSISRHDTGVSIRFNTASEQVSQLLTQNVQSLVQTLAAKGVDVGDVRIVPNNPAGSATFQSGSGSSRDSRQGSRGGGGDGGRGGQRGGR